MQNVGLTGIVLNLEALLSIGTYSESLGLIWIIVSDPVNVNNNSQHLTVTIVVLLSNAKWLGSVGLVVFVSIFRPDSTGCWVACVLIAAKNTNINNWNDCRSLCHLLAKLSCSRETAISALFWKSSQRIEIHVDINVTKLLRNCEREMGLGESWSVHSGATTVGARCCCFVDFSIVSGVHVSWLIYTKLNET